VSDYSIDRIRSVVSTRDVVYVSFFSPSEGEGLSLVTRLGNVDFVPVDIKMVEQVYGLKRPQDFKVFVESVTKSEYSKCCAVKTNFLTDWFVPGKKTVQVELLAAAPFSVSFRNPIEVRNAKGPVVFQAHVANHRARADLIVEFTDLDTDLTTRSTVAFSPNFLGGTTLESYQKVAVAAPEGAKNLTIKISFDFIEKSSKSEEAPPFLFLCDTVASEMAADKQSGDISFSEVDFNFFWMNARSPVPLDGLDYAFLKCGLKTNPVMTKAVKKAMGFFDENYYRKTNLDVDFKNIDPFTSYLMEGRIGHRNPGPELSVREYLLRHPDVDAANFDPLMHYANVGQAENRSLGTFEEKIAENWRGSGHEMPHGSEVVIFQRAQDLMFPMNIVGTRKLSVFIVPEHDAMSGGIYSMFSIANHARQLRRQHGYDVVMMTRPNPTGLTYLRNSSFRNSETVLRFEQLRLFAEVSELQIHIPEYATVEFARRLSPEMQHYLMGRDHVHINILNQNIKLMPEAVQFRDLLRISDSIGQSVSHHAYFGQDWADRYELPTMLLPAYTDLTPYPPASFEEKEGLILYSLDEAPYRREVLKKLSEMTDYKLVEIRDMHFDTYMDLATRCRFSVSFGEGLDGYVAQPMYQGGIGLALYNEDFFPDASYADFENFFSSEAEMVNEIVPTIRRLEADRIRYQELNAALRAKWDELYDYKDYVQRIGRLMLREYEVQPRPKGTIA
jgi:hypothetical protein